jgi:hypothetical protein
METLEATCCVIGGGPAGVAVTVLEKHNDFLRDFSGIRPGAHSSMISQPP